MSDQPSITIKPTISYPRIAQVGKSYLMLVDVQMMTGPTDWPYEEEEYPILLIVNTTPAFSYEPIDHDSPVLVLHRFGGTYGPARFLLTAAPDEMTGTITVTLVNRWGMPLDQIAVQSEIRETVDERQQTIVKERPTSIRQRVPNAVKTLEAVDTIRWLHLSDFQTKNNEKQRITFGHLLTSIRAKVDAGLAPDLIFMTGDIASRGRVSEYEVFFDEFFVPLTDIVGGNAIKTTFIVPGNHDADRNQAVDVQMRDILSTIPGLLDPTEAGLSLRESLLPRFRSYVDHDMTGTKQRHWLFSPQGAYIHRMNIGGQELGILGLNTAWLSRGDGDRGNLSPGRFIVENGLDALKACDIRIVLGHHPIDWFLDTELKPIRALFERYNVIYLHGHRHQTTRQNNSIDNSFLTMDAGSYFQAREDQQAVTRLVWCALDTRTKQIHVEPLSWSQDQQSWIIDSAAFPQHFRQPDADEWILPLPLISNQPLPAAGFDLHAVNLPDDWQIINKAYLEKYRQNSLSDEQALRFFDGDAPTWQIALSSAIPQRNIVQYLQQALKEAFLKGDLKVTLLSGGAGEGKSTVLRQVVCNIVETDPAWNVIWHEDTATPLPLAFLHELSLTPQNWLIVSDEAEIIASQVFEAIQKLHTERRGGLQFLLCSRDLDWKERNADKLSWKRYVDYLSLSLNGLDFADAQLIVQAWSQYGSAGLGKLSGLPLEEAAHLLRDRAASEASTEEGSFLGAILQVRITEDLNSHVMDLLTRLTKRRVPGGTTLFDAYIYIAILHARNIKLLTKELLAATLGCKVSDIMSGVIAPLEKEAAVSVSSGYILTRHRIIAQVAIQLTTEKWQVDIEERWANLLQAAVQRSSMRSRVANSDTARWRNLPSLILNSESGPRRQQTVEDQHLAIHLAETLVKIEPDNPYYITKFGQILRQTGEVQRAVGMFRDTAIRANTDKVYDRIKNDRGFYFEWAACEGMAGHIALDAWLAGISLADRVGPSLARVPKIDQDHAGQSLAGLATAFDKLFDTYNLTAFSMACAGTVQLGLLLPLPARTQRILQTRQNKFREKGIESLDSSTAFAALKAGIVAAWERREDKLPPWIQTGDALTFDALARLLNRERK